MNNLFIFRWTPIETKRSHFKMIENLVEFHKNPVYRKIVLGILLH